MDSTRRLFLGTALSGVVPLTVNVRALAQASAADTGRDHVFDHIERELVGALNGARASGVVRGERLQQVASSLRLLSAHGTARGVWSGADRRLARAIRERGTAGAAAEQPTDAALQQLRAEFSRAGATVGRDDLTRALSIADAAAYERAVARLGARGLAREIADAAASIEQLARTVDMRPLVLARANAQVNAEACRDLWWNIVILEAAVIATAVTAPFAAAQLALALLFLQHYYSLMGC